MGDTYFDAVLDNRMSPLFNGTQEKTVEWIKQNVPMYYSDAYQVCIGKTMQVVSVEEYLDMVRKAEEKAEKERLSKVYKLVQEAINRAENNQVYPHPGWNSAAVAEEIAKEIVKLFR